MHLFLKSIRFGTSNVLDITEQKLYMTLQVGFTIFTDVVRVVFEKDWQIASLNGPSNFNNALVDITLYRMKWRL